MPKNQDDDQAGDALFYPPLDVKITAENKRGFCTGSKCARQANRSSPSH